MGLGGALATFDRRYRVRVKTHAREALGLVGQGTWVSKRAILSLPPGIFLIVTVLLSRGPWLDPSELPPVLTDKPFPAFDLPSV